jgi:high-affinity iron transporter
VIRLFVAVTLFAATASAVAADAPPPPTAPPKAPARSGALVERGRASFGVNCAACHGATGEGNGPVAFAVRPRPRNLRRDPFVRGDRVEQIFATITRGLPSGTMASYAQLSDDERWGLAWYVAGMRPPPR